RVSATFRRTFTLASEEAGDDDPLVPQVKPATYDAPSLSWSPHPSTTRDRNDKPLPVHYRVEVRKSDAEVWLSTATAPVLSTKWEFPAATDTSDYFLAEGDYVWRVSAYDSEGTFLGRGPQATFTVLPLEAVTGQRIALSGLALDE